MIDMRHTPTCFAVQFQLQELAVDPLLAAAIERMPARVPFADSGSNAADVSASKMCRGERNAFARQVYDEIQAIKDSSRFRDLDRLVDEHHPLNKLAYEFEKMIVPLLRSLSPVEAHWLVRVDAAKLLECVARGRDGALCVQRDKLQQLILAQKAAAPQQTLQEDSVQESVRLRAPVKWQFVPKQPLVELLPDVGYAIKFVSIGRQVATEVVVRAVRAVRAVMEPENLRLLRVSPSQARDVIETAMRLSFGRNRQHFVLACKRKRRKSLCGITANV